MATNEATIGALTQAVTLALADKMELEQGVTPSNSSKYANLGQAYDLFNADRGTVGTLTVVSGTATANLSSGRRAFFRMTVNANFTLALSNVPAGASFLCIQFTTSSPGGYGVGLPASFHAMAGSGTTVITTANTVCYLRAYTIDGGTSWYYIIDAGDAGGGSYTAPTQATLSAAIMARSPKLYYKCTELSGTTLADSSGNGMDLTLRGTNVLGFAQLIDGGGSIQSQGSGNGATRGDAAGITLPVNYDWSYVGIISYEDTSSSTQGVPLTLLASGDTSATNAQFQINIIYTTSQLRITTLWEHGAGADVTTNGTVFPGGIPTMLGIRKNSTPKTVDFFLNGRKVLTTPYTNEPDGGSSSTLQLNANGGSISTSNQAWFASALTDNDFKAIAQAGGYW